MYDLMFVWILQFENKKFILLPLLLICPRSFPWKSCAICHSYTMRFNLNQEFEIWSFQRQNIDWQKHSAALVQFTSKDLTSLPLPGI